MTRAIQAVDIYDSLKQTLSLHWLVDNGVRKNNRITQADLRNHVSLVGHFNPIRPHRIPVFGLSEFTHISSLHAEHASRTIVSVYRHNPVAIIVSDRVNLPAPILSRLKRAKINLLKAQTSSTKVIEQIQFFITREFSERCVMHGVFLEVLGVGLLITGDSGIGKSELALDLLTRGHRLVADDAPQFSRTYPNAIVGECPETINQFLEVRGLGILNIQAMFGDSAITPKKQLSLIIHLQQMGDKSINQDRLSGTRKVRSILGVGVPQVALPVAPGRNLAVLVEVAVRDYLLRAKGYNAEEALMNQQMRAIQENSHENSHR